ncbi:hypothetical protein ACUIJQ_03575 [Levilactobacillus hammesii]|uniref:Uncharacterized protein n=1 Tax=Levilactobacillus hammesii DSM 16381 TaxID=1423753 RepID=A0A0R1ULJ8_9LACO|nr:hypothetical protein [Levilactobacillus hammesii]KRL94124.1 hypothetical protein FD28_GL000673 [Levilactobacillus hammesii DSM 16381]
MMMSHNTLTGALILLTGIALLVFIIFKLFPRTNQKADQDTKALLLIFTLLGVGLLGMGSWVCFI